MATFLREQDAHCQLIKEDQIALVGKIGEEGLEFEAHMQASTYGGSIWTENENLVIENADVVTLIIAVSTSYINQNDTSVDPRMPMQQHIKSS